MVRTAVVTLILLGSAACEEPVGPAFSLGPFLVAATGGDHSCALTFDGAAFCWGRGMAGQLGNHSFDERERPDTVVGSHRFRQIVAGRSHTCALRLDDRAFCWGTNGLGQRGNAFENRANSPVPVWGDYSFVDISAGWYHNCALTSVGLARCWGANQFGQLGLGTTTQRELFAELVRGRHQFVDIAAGALHTCAVAADGRIFCWGANLDGELGNGTTLAATEPTPVDTQERFVSVTAGGAHTCAVSRGGAAYCWGANTEGQLGVGDDIPASVPFVTTPRRVNAVPYFRSLSAGDAMTCGITTAGDALCWGRGAAGQLGNGALAGTRAPSPVVPPGGPARAFRHLDAAGTSHVCGTTVGGVAYCWGTGERGELGAGPVRFRNVPMEVNCCGG